MKKILNSYIFSIRDVFDSISYEDGDMLRNSELTTGGLIVPSILDDEIYSGLSIIKSSMDLNSLSIIMDNGKGRKITLLQKIIETLRRDIPMGSCMNYTHPREQYIVSDFKNKCNLELKKNPHLELYPTTLLNEMDGIKSQINTLSSNHNYIMIMLDDNNQVYIIIKTSPKDIGVSIKSYFYGMAKSLMKIWVKKILEKGVSIPPVIPIGSIEGLSFHKWNTLLSKIESSNIYDLHGWIISIFRDTYSMFHKNISTSYIYNELISGITINKGGIISHFNQLGRFTTKCSKDGICSGFIFGGFDGPSYLISGPEGGKFPYSIGRVNRVGVETGEDFIKIMSKSNINISGMSNFDLHAQELSSNYNKLRDVKIPDYIKIEKELRPIAILGD